MFNKAVIQKYIEEISLFEEVKLEDIPDIDLYMDQVNIFFEKKLSYLKRNEEDKLLTKTMINNYTKAGILMPSNKKKYTPQHISLLILIYKLKQILSINDIVALFKPLLSKLKNEESYEFINTIYSISQEVNLDKYDYQFDNLCEHKIKLIEDKCNEIEIDEKEFLEWFLLVMLLVNQASLQKRLAEKIIDDYFKKILNNIR